MEEAAMKVALMADFFRQVRKRRPEHLREVEEFLSGLGYPLELSEFHELEIRPAARNRLWIEYSVFTGEQEWSERRRLEMTFLVPGRAAKGKSARLRLRDAASASVEELCFS